ncbi:WXG100 family type VII secretion target [Streptacidiphilus neutrinimicus]|uniref:WXG100 family type VII secretion target n=1 Tax=Streptacidiphilus neutrinimicus TaxID=105420 RepID=UPI0005A8F35E|nr:hypothetical protein [Streptacidiphilus neutrinimicus]
MGDKSLERAINPWMFDKSGNLTSAAQQQFPDSTRTPAAITTSSVGPGVLQMDVTILRACGDRANALSSQVTTELGAPQLDVTDAVTSLIGLDSSGALNTAWSMWQQQYQNLSTTLNSIGQNLIEGASSTSETDHHNAGRFRPE